MKKSFLLKITISLLVLFYLASFQNKNEEIFTNNSDRQVKLSVKAKEALTYCNNNGFSEEQCILIDMGIHSGKERLFLWSFKQDSIILKSLCSHGCGKQEWGIDETKTAPVFSNINNSHCSSLGKYKIGKRGYSQWGINVNYKLHGLEKTNSNAYKRFIVFHSWYMIPDDEPFPTGTPEGWGCPAVSNNTLMQLDPYLKNSNKPILLWIYK